ncbi:MAG: hypothetical protein O2968_12505 [Acidobacteria bacterium]|nr:hypothetical protein [Acidobacteriota bacterium]
MRNRNLLLMLLALGLVLPAAAAIRKEGGYWVEVKEGAIPAGTRLRITSVGPISVQGDSGKDIRYKVTRKLRAAKLEEAERLLEQAPVAAALQNVTAVISNESPSCRRCGFSSELEIRVPYRTHRAVVDSEGGSLRVRSLLGRLNANTHAGSITVEDVEGSVRANTAGGNITLTSIGGEILCDTAGGSITLDGGRANATLTTSGGSISATNVRGTVRAETAGGGITAEKIAGDLIAGTSGGTIKINDVGGRVRAESAGGSVNVTSAPQGVRVETAGGKIYLRDVAGAVVAANATGSIQVYFLSGRPLGDSLLETNVGSIDVWLPADLKVTIDAIVELAGNPNRIQSDFSAIRVRRDEDSFGPASVTAEGVLNGGGPVLRILNTAGQIKIRRLE